jgi:lysophospholipase L1-like esterase
MSPSRSPRDRRGAEAQADGCIPIALARIIDAAFFLGRITMNGLRCATLALALAMGTTGMAQELIADGFAAAAPAAGLRGWQVFGLLGGTVKPFGVAPDEGALLTTERVEMMTGTESWQGCLVRTSPIEVLPGRRYRFKVDARGDGLLTVGLFEYGWKHSAKRLASPSVTAPLAYAERTVTFDYTPTTDAVMYVRPFVQISGWLKRAEVRRPSFTALLGKGAVSLKATHFGVTPHGRVPIVLRSSAWPVKLLLYGPSGDSGPGGDMGGSGAFVEVFKAAVMQEGAAGPELSIPAPLAAGPLEGSYHLVAVEPESGATADAYFTVFGPARLRDFMQLAQKATLAKGARLVFLGDSLTALFPGRNYPSIVDRALQWGIPGEAQVFNAGVGGDTIARMAARLDKDVLAHNPTRVFIFEGANSCKRPYDPKTGKMGDWALPKDKYEAAWRDVLTRITAKGAKITIMTMAPGDRSILESFEAQARGMGEVKNFWCLPGDVAEAVAIQKRLAAEFKADVIDTNAAMQAAMQERDRTKGREYLHVDDGVHIGEHGNREVAKAVLKYLGGGK